LKINVVERNPLPEELGLRFLKDGALLSAEEMAKADELVKKLQGRRLDDLRVVCLYPWYCRLFRSLQGTSVPRRLLIKYSEKKAFEPPLHDLELIENEILDRQNYATRPFESCEKWSKRRGYNFTAKRYTEDELVGEVSRNLQGKVSP